jgi:hypothetical protein
MDRQPLRLLLVVCAAVFGAWQLWSSRPVHPPDGPIAPDEPVQVDHEPAPPIRIGHWSLTGRAHYDITARILSREDYRLDGVSDLSPEDLALGWGRMSDNQVISQLSISQGARFYSWHTRTPLPIPKDEINTHSANTHLIPADNSVRRQLGRLRVGEVVHLRGELVDAVKDDGRWWHTSLTRTDTGDGACELMLVQDVETSGS